MYIKEILDQAGMVVISKAEFDDMKRKLARLREIEDELIGRADKNANAEKAVCICAAGLLWLTAVAAVGQCAGWW